MTDLKTLEDLECEEPGEGFLTRSCELRLEAQKVGDIFKCFAGWCLSHHLGLEHTKDCDQHTAADCEVITEDNWREWFFNLKDKERVVGGLK